MANLVNTANADATTLDVQSGKTFYVMGKKLTGAQGFYVDGDTLYCPSDWYVDGDTLVIPSSWLNG